MAVQIHTIGVLQLGVGNDAICYSASSERKLLLHKLMCIILSVVMP
jgi:hypothetical protein